MVQLPDQNATDFTKTLNYLMEQEIVSENQVCVCFKLSLCSVCQTVYSLVRKLNMVFKFVLQSILK